MKIGIPVYDGVGMPDIAGALYMCTVCEGAMLLMASGLLDDQWATTRWAFPECFPAPAFRAGSPSPDRRQNFGRSR